MQCGTPPGGLLWVPCGLPVTRRRGAGPSVLLAPSRADASPMHSSRLRGLGCADPPSRPLSARDAKEVRPMAPADVVEPEPMEDGCGARGEDASASAAQDECPGSA